MSDKGLTKVKFTLSSNGLFGNPKVLELKPYSFAQVHKMITAHGRGDLAETLGAWIEVFEDNLVSPANVNFSNFTIDELTEILILCHYNFIAPVLPVEITYLDTGETAVVELDIKDIKFDILKLSKEFEEFDLNEIQLTSPSGDVLIGTAVRVRDLIEAFERSQTKAAEYKNKFYSEFKRYELAESTGNLDSVPLKIKKLVEKGSFIFQEEMDKASMAAQIVSYNDLKPVNLEEKIELLNIIDPISLQTLENIIADDFYHGPSRLITYEKRQARCSFRLSEIIPSLQQSRSNEYKITLGTRSATKLDKPSDE